MRVEVFVRLWFVCEHESNCMVSCMLVHSGGCLFAKLTIVEMVLCVFVCVSMMTNSFDWVAALFTESKQTQV